ncbi:MAG: hypothetical protein E7351_02875 [Clostridiales bacterium]|nr:hypothetical protein [Clostridiales bacterium]
MSDLITRINSKNQTNSPKSTNPTHRNTPSNKGKTTVNYKAKNSVDRKGQCILAKKLYDTTINNDY